MEETKVDITEIVGQSGKRLYEAMFLVDSAQAGSDWEGTLAAVNRVLERAEADVVSLRKWADRKLAYEIDHKGRGTYILAFFHADPLKIASIEKDVNLSEQIARVLVLSTEGRPEECIRRDVSGESKPPTDYVRPGERPPRREAAETTRSDPVDEAPRETPQTPSGEAGGEASEPSAQVPAKEIAAETVEEAAEGRE